MTRRNRKQSRMPKRMPNYVPKLLALPYTQPGAVVSVQVQHDDWCLFLNGRGACNCNPDVVPVVLHNPRRN